MIVFILTARHTGRCFGTKSKRRCPLFSLSASFIAGGASNLKRNSPRKRSDRTWEVAWSTRLLHLDEKGEGGKAQAAKLPISLSTDPPLGAGWWIRHFSRGGA